MDFTWQVNALDAYNASPHLHNFHHLLPDGRVINIPYKQVSLPCEYTGLNPYGFWKVPTSWSSSWYNPQHRPQQIHFLDKNICLVYTDGSCRQDCQGTGPFQYGPGGWAWVIPNPQNSEQALLDGQGPVPTVNTSANQMELMAIIKACEAFAQILNLTLLVVTDSEYAGKMIYENCSGWETNGWKRFNGQPLKHLELIVPYLHYKKYDKLIAIQKKGLSKDSSHKLAHTRAKAESRKAAERFLSARNEAHISGTNLQHIQLN